MFAILTLVALLLSGAVTPNVLPGGPSYATTPSTTSDSTAAPRAVDDVIQGGPS